MTPEQYKELIEEAIKNRNWSAFSECNTFRMLQLKQVASSISGLNITSAWIDEGIYYAQLEGEIKTMTIEGKVTYEY